MLPSSSANVLNALRDIHECADPEAAFGAVNSVPYSPAQQAHHSRNVTLSLPPLMNNNKASKTAPYVKEKAWHRTAAYLAAQGLERNKIAEACGKTPATVTALMSQPFFNGLVATIIDQFNLVDEGAVSLLRSAAPAAAQRLIYLAEHAKSESVQLSSADTILNRVMGRPVQTVISEKRSCALDPTKELETLRSDVERLSKNLPNTHVVLQPSNS